MIEWQRVGLFRYFLEGEVLVELERTVCESATPGVELLPLAMTSCLLYLFKVTLRVQHDSERLLHGWKCGVLFGAGCSARFVVFFLHLAFLVFLIPVFLFQLPGLWMCSHPGTQPLPQHLRFSIVFAYRVNCSSLPRHTFSVRNKLGSAKSCARPSRRAVNWCSAAAGDK